mgnify:CR=1 FL=1
MHYNCGVSLPLPQSFPPPISRRCYAGGGAPGSGAAHSASETQSTLEFASRASRVAVHAVRNEVLDYRDMLRHYGGARQLVIEGGDHALSDFGEHLPHLLRFLHLCD